ncbi:MAG: phosphoenolpyruvate carboxylase [Planctomycetota bacterium]
MSENTFDPHAPLRDDVRRLGAMLGRVVCRREGEEVFALVERVRGLAKEARAENETALRELRDILDARSHDTTLAVTRAFAHFLSLANIAEQYHRTRRRRDYLEDEAGPPQAGSLDEGFARLLAAGVAPEDLATALAETELEFVLTAHLTEVNRRTILQRHRRIAELLAARERVDLPPAEHDRLDEETEREIAIIWDSDEILRRRPTPLEEANGGLLVFEQTLWEAIPRFYRALDASLERHTGRTLPLEAAPIRFGSWMGGDRDGNPNVTADVTRRVAGLGRWMGCDLLWKEVDQLRAELSLETAGRELRARVGPEREPYRRWLGLVRDRLAAARAVARATLRGEVASDEDRERAYRRRAELREDLLVVRDSLHETGQELVARGRLRDLLRRVAVFGLDLVRLDLRQESTRHTDALDAITRAIGLAPYGDLDEAARCAFLESELAGRRPLLPRRFEADDEVTECLATFTAIAGIEREALGNYVISMARQASDVLAVELLQREAGVAESLPVVPLFETLDDLERAPRVVARLLDSPPIRERIAARGGRFEVMIGYSDSAKDAGLLAAAWALQRAQEDMTREARSRGVELIFFHGRGGAVGRGGGPTHEAILSLPSGSVGRAMRVTVQGEVVQEQLGLTEIALRQFEQSTTAMLAARLTPPAPPEDAWRSRADELARVSCAAYRDVVREDPEFVPYFRGVTPEPELAELNVGSRPARRRSGGGVESLRAIPWNFAWTQTRLLLPSWLGIGAALEDALATPDGATELRRMARDWPFFRSFLHLAEMVAAKVEPEVHALYEKVLAPPGVSTLGPRLAAAFARTRDAVLRTLEHDELLETNEVIRRSIEVRNPYVDPLNVIQAIVLARYRERPDEATRDALHVAVNGIAAGLRNTG